MKVLIHSIFHVINQGRHLFCSLLADHIVYSQPGRQVNCAEYPVDKVGLRLMGARGQKRETLRVPFSRGEGHRRGGNEQMALAPEAPADVTHASKPNHVPNATLFWKVIYKFGICLSGWQQYV